MFFAGSLVSDMSQAARWRQHRIMQLQGSGRGFGRRPSPPFISRDLTVGCKIMKRYSGVGAQ
jgi:hypothetical protein